MTPDELSAALREGQEPFLQNRRKITALSLFNVAAMGTITLFQMGVTKHVVQPSLPGEDADRINGSAQAYAILETPDAALAVGSYAATLALTAMAPPDRAQMQPLVPLAMTAKSLLDAAFALKLLWDQPTKYKSYCLWCVLSALATLAIVPLAWPEARAAWKTFKGNR